MDTINDDFLYEHMARYDEYILSTIPDDEQLNHTFSNRFNNQMEKLIKDEKKSTFFINFKYYPKIAIIYTFLIASVTLGVATTALAYRVNNIEIISTLFQEFTSIRTYGSKDTQDRTLIPIESSYIPDGYTETEKTIDDFEQTIVYSNNAGDEIIYRQILLTNSEILLDTEKAHTDNTVIDDTMVNTINKKGHSGAYWNDTEYFYSISGNVDESTLLDMTKNILQKN